MLHQLSQPGTQMLNFQKPRKSNQIVTGQRAKILLNSDSCDYNQCRREGKTFRNRYLERWYQMTDLLISPRKETCKDSRVSYPFPYQLQLSTFLHPSQTSLSLSGSKRTFIILVTRSSSTQGILPRVPNLVFGSFKSKFRVQVTFS